MSHKILPHFTLLILSVVTSVQPSSTFRSQTSQTIISQTTCGDVTGVVSTIGTTSPSVFEFHNVPYAKPPVGALRFAAPRLHNAKNPWVGPVDATEERVVKCVQGGVGEAASGTEDCLVMTIRSTDLRVPKPVVVWVHGGGLTIGYCCLKGYSFDTKLTQMLDVVTVNINFRLGFLGFHSIKELWDTEGGVVANNGIRDIIAALQWIQENIVSFGGDPTSVTIMGHSAGATASLALISSPLALNLFHRVIALSPAPEMRLNFKKGSKYQSKIYKVLQGTGCEMADNKKRCLQDLPAGYFTIHDEHFNPSGKLRPNPFMAYFDFPGRHGEELVCAGLIMTDPYVVTQAPKHLAESGSTPLNKVKVILSNTLHENSVLSFFHQTNIQTDYASLNDTLEHVIPGVTSRPVEDVMSLIYEEYSSLSPQLMWDTLTTDMRSTCPTNDVAEAMARSSNHDIYRLFITFTTPNMPAFHGLEVESVFGYHFIGNNIPANGKMRRFRRVLVDLIRNFAEDGSLPEGVGTFPSSTMIIDSSDNMVNISTSKPRETICEKLRDLGLLEYGWQN